MNGSRPAGHRVVHGASDQVEAGRAASAPRVARSPIVTLAVLAMTAVPAAAADSDRSPGRGWIPAVLDPARQTTVVVELRGSPVAVREAGARSNGTDACRSWARP